MRELPDFNIPIEVDGNDGTGKSTLVSGLRGLGFTQVSDRGRMTKATDDPSVFPAPGVKYILLVCPWEESKQRLVARGADMSDPFHRDDKLQYYDHKFREIIPKFNPVVIDTSLQSNVGMLSDIPTAVSRENAVLESLRGILGTCKIHVGLPTGRLQQHLEGFHGSPKFPIWPLHISSSMDRKLVYERKSLTFFRNRTSTYPQMVFFGNLDLAFVGSDVLDSSPFAAQCRVIHSAPQRGVSLCFASVDGELRANHGILRVATPFPELARKILRKREIPHTIYSVSGGTEAMVPRFADTLLDIVQTGDTLRQNGLQIVENLGEMTINLIARK